MSQKSQLTVTAVYAAKQSIEDYMFMVASSP